MVHTYVRTTCAGLLAEDAFQPHHHLFLFLILLCGIVLARDGDGGEGGCVCGKTLRTPRNGPALHRIREALSRRNLRFLSLSLFPTNDSNPLACLQRYVARRPGMRVGGGKKVWMNESGVVEKVRRE